MKVWITKFALTDGIFETEATDTGTGKGAVYYTSSSYDNDRFAYEGEWFIDKSDAIKEAYKMRDKEIALLYERIGYLKGLEFH